jgi:DivIVA domain-containing protein
VTQGLPRDRQRLAELVGGIQFSESQLRPGYTKADVDRFVGDLRATLAGTRQPPLTAADVRSVIFRTTRLRRGYDEEQVDAFLDEVVRGLAADPGQPAGSDPLAGPGPVVF